MNSLYIYITQEMLSLKELDINLDRLSGTGGSVTAWESPATLTVAGCLSCEFIH